MPHTLLLADDSVTIQRVIELTFADEDVQVIAVSDGDQAIERLEASPVDIVLADIGMPGKNGYEVAQYIRQTPHLAHIPVVLLTGAFEPVDQARAAEAGCDGVLAKPFEPQLVIGRVKELLARPRRELPALDTGLAPPPSGAVEQWVPPLVDQSLTAAPASPAPTGELTDYFDRLDAAFASLSTAPPPPLKPIAPPGPPRAVADEIDWFSTPESAAPVSDQWDLPASALDSPAADLPMSYGSPPAPVSPLVAAPVAHDATFAPGPAFDEPVEVAEPPAPFAAAAPVAPARPVEPFVPAPAPPPPAPPKPATLPPLSDAFAALLAAEQGSPHPPTAPVWPATAPPALAITDDVIEDVTRRVLDQLSDQVVRQTVADIVSKVAERLVSEEIERIKASIK